MRRKLAQKLGLYSVTAVMVLQSAFTSIGNASTPTYSLNRGAPLPKTTDPKVVQKNNSVQELPPVSALEIQRYIRLKKYLSNLEPKTGVYTNRNPLINYLKYFTPSGNDKTTDVIAQAVAYRTANPDLLIVNRYPAHMLNAQGPARKPFSLMPAQYKLGLSENTIGVAYFDFENSIWLNEKVVMDKNTSSIAIADLVSHETLHKSGQIKAFQKREPLENLQIIAKQKTLEKKLGVLSHQDYLADRSWLTRWYYELRKKGFETQRDERAFVSAMMENTTNKWNDIKYKMDPLEVGVRLSKVRQTYENMTGNSVVTPHEAVKALNYFGANMDQDVVNEILKERGLPTVAVFKASKYSRFPGSNHPVMERKDIEQIVDLINTTNPVGYHTQSVEKIKIHREAHKLILQQLILTMPGIASVDKGIDTGIV